MFQSNQLSLVHIVSVSHILQRLKYIFLSFAFNLIRLGICTSDILERPRLEKWPFDMNKLTEWLLQIFSLPIVHFPEIYIHSLCNWYQVKVFLILVNKKGWVCWNRHHCHCHLLKLEKRSHQKVALPLLMVTRQNVSIAFGFKQWPTDKKKVVFTIFV